MSARLAAWTLLLGNFVTALAILGPAGMLADLANGLGVTIRDAGLLVTFGAVVLCFGSPLMAWATSGLERRRLLIVILSALAVGLTASALAPDYLTLLALRIAMLSFGAIYTPMAASTIALIVPVKERPAAIVFVFLGWSIAIAVGLPLIALAAAQIGWRATYGAIGALALLALVLHRLALPGGLRAPPLSLKSWGAIARSPLIVLLLLVTIFWTGGQFVLFPYLGPLITALAGGGTAAIGGAFAIMGVLGFLGNIAATRTVLRYGVFNTSLIFLSSMVLGTLTWAVGAGWLPAMIIGVALWGLGFAAFNSMQQARLVAAAPDLSTATVALNTSANYVGQSLGSGLGAVMFSGGELIAMGYVAAGFMLVGLAILILTHRRIRPDV